MIYFLRMDETRADIFFNVSNGIVNNKTEKIKPYGKSGSRILPITIDLLFFFVNKWHCVN